MFLVVSLKNNYKIIIFLKNEVILIMINNFKINKLLNLNFILFYFVVHIK
jgi:hypothetical protein